MNVVPDKKNYYRFLVDRILLLSLELLVLLCLRVYNEGLSSSCPSPLSLIVAICICRRLY